MPINTKYQATFKHNCYYHVFNRSVSGTKLFSNPRNYSFFLQRFSKYLSDVLEVYTWCLIPNHFHFLVSVKPISECVFSQNEKKHFEDKLIDIHGIIVRRFKNFFISYSHAYKRQQNINTNVFAQHFKRSEIDKEDYFSNVIQYIHLNPLHHKTTINWEDYQWSSYKRIVAGAKTLLKTQEVLDWFGGVDAFIKYHHIRKQ